jgi:hypothetical protein
MGQDINPSEPTHGQIQRHARALRGPLIKYILRLAVTAIGASIALGVSCSAVAAVPAPPSLTFVFEETVTLAADITPGKTALGDRNIVPITGGTFTGPGDGNGFNGTILPGGWDWQLKRSDNCLMIKADYMLKTDDGAIINIVNQGPLCMPKPGAQMSPVRTTPVFEPPVGKYEWLGRSTFVGTLEPATSTSGPAVHIRIYRVD